MLHSGAWKCGSGFVQRIGSMCLGILIPTNAFADLLEKTVHIRVVPGSRMLSVYDGSGCILEMTSHLHGKRETCRTAHDP